MHVMQQPTVRKVATRLVMHADVQDDPNRSVVSQGERSGGVPKPGMCQNPVPYGDTLFSAKISRQVFAPIMPQLNTVPATHDHCDDVTAATNSCTRSTRTHPQFMESTRA